MDVMQSMEVFRRVVEAESFSAVARETNMSQSTVSKHVAALEERLGIKLLNRSTRSLNPTEAGNAYYHDCIRLLNDFNEAEASIGKGKIKPTGTLRLSTSTAFGRTFIIPFLSEFLTQYPEINCDLVFNEHYIDLVKEGIDLAIRIGPLADSTLIAQKIGMSQRVVVASPSYLVKHGRPRKPADLINHNCLLYSQQKSPGLWFFHSTKDGDETVRVASRFKANSPDVITDAAISSLGIAMMCDWSVRDYIKQGKLNVILPSYTTTPLEVHAIYPERRFIPQKVKQVIDCLRMRFQQYEDQIKQNR